MESTSIQSVIQEMKARALNTQKKQTQLNCRTFLRKLGYKARSQRLIQLVELEVKKQGMQFVLPKGMTSWKEIDPDGKILLAVTAAPDVKRHVSQITCEGLVRPYPLYAFQQAAVETMEARYEEGNMRGLLVLPTGGGKTTTAVEWLMPHLLQGKRVLWLAHRHELLEQALATFKRAASYRKQSPITYRLVSGKHQSMKGLTTEQLVIASKDSAYLQQALLKWCDSQEVIVVVDEAHHAVARTYRILLMDIRKCAKRMTLLGLTATPYRTSEDEAGALKKIFTRAKVAGGYRCMKTGVVSASKKDFVIAYKKPLSRGGQTTLDNLMIIKK